jgi:glutathione peroxidase
MESTIYDFSVKDQAGKLESLSKYKGKALLVVNTATGCGFTPQYEGLESMYKKYKDQGFEILDFPCNQFANQAPGSDGEIHDYCVSRFAMTFPQYSKLDVNGKNEAPLYAWLKSQKGGVLSSAIKWNFTKFLIDRDGAVVARFAPNVEPKDIESKVAALL